MRFYENYKDIVAIIEKSAGNDSVGSMWLETKVFNKDVSISKIIEWAEIFRTDGRLIITVNQPD